MTFLAWKRIIGIWQLATAETVELGPAHPPKEDSITVFSEILTDLKKQLVHLRHDYNKHEPEYFAAAKNISNDELTDFSTGDVESVRVATSAYGIHLFAKLRIPALADDGPAYVHFRVFIGGGGDPPKLHSIHTEEKEHSDGDKTYRAIFTKDDELEWFDT
ncbi:hypothetical protein B0T10DRAFT_557381 [Thelonectria olida]|uniref:Uncharacterized protein n=1 Tax=Thelonectria olida TaxID=1576542 RepID=A0A9P8WET2_9HYPO|nr:hypothetical protein B0T10DRAFT_557381 [Thelonectria olida]